MKQDAYLSSLSTVTGCVALLAICTYASLGDAGPLDEDTAPAAEQSWPPDTTPYARPLQDDELAPEFVLPPEESLEGTDLEAETGAHGRLQRILVVDTVVNNTDPNLTNTDVQNDGETSIAINPRGRKEIVISAFSGGWGAAAPIYHSVDGGQTWTRQFSVPVPPGWSGGCPCDWTWDYGRRGQASVSILASKPTTPGFDVVTGTTTDPADVTAFNYFVPMGSVQAEETNINVPTSLGNADQPWLQVNRDPDEKRQDNVYVAWDDFANSDAVDGVDMRVAVSYGLNPPEFTEDQQVGNSLGAINPGFRLADDPVRGNMWALWGRNVAAGAGDSKNIDYMLNRTIDGGATWGLDGNSLGIVVANADSTQPQPKFGTVNALLGGVQHAGVDPRNGHLYYVYGNRDADTGKDRLAIREIFADRDGNVTIGDENFVTGQVEAAIPQVAVLRDGTVSVFYYTFEGLSLSGFPIFAAHLALSRDRGVTFADYLLVSFLSSAQDNGDPRQRVLGDYMQMKALKNCFYGSFTANGAPFGRPFANHDPIFFKTCG